LQYYFLTTVEFQSKSGAGSGRPIYRTKKRAESTPIVGVWYVQIFEKLPFQENLCYRWRQPAARPQTISTIINSLNKSEGITFYKL